MQRFCVILVRWKKKNYVTKKEATASNTTDRIEGNVSKFVAKTTDELMRSNSTAAQDANTTDDKSINASKSKYSQKTLEDLEEVKATVTQQITSSRKSRSIKRPLGESQENVTPKRKYNATEKKPVHSVRYDGIEHFPRINKDRMVRCKYEGCNKKSYFYCSKCNVHLCLCVIENRNCFEPFHTANV